VFPAILAAEFKPPGSPKGDLKALPLEGSVPVGEVFAVEEPERETAGCGRYPKVRRSDLADDIIDYPLHQKISRIVAREMGRWLFLECIVTSIPIPTSIMYEANDWTCDGTRRQDDNLVNFYRVVEMRKSNL
jgi:hypothetical protein